MTRSIGGASVLALAVVVASLGSLAAGCGGAALRAAERGDAARLRAEIADKHRRGALSNGEAADIARAVASREIREAKTEALAVARLDDTRACTVELDDVLADRMKTPDGAGAEAALARLEARSLSEGAARDYLRDGDDRWRAVGVRALTRSGAGDGDARRKAMLDPSPRVRRSALRASADAGDAGDVEVLLETARLDPEPLLQNLAIRSISAILRASGARERAGEIATRLRDHWTSGDDAVREEVAVAWALSPVFEAGGREALRLQIATASGPGAIAAAGVVLRTAPKDAELVSLASALLARTIREGSRRDRLHAIATARPDPNVLEALRKVASDGDPEARIAALGRLVASAPDKARATGDLEKIAGYGIRAAGKGPERADDAVLREQAARARLALAYAGDARIQAWIEEDLASELPGRRASAASALAALGRAARAAPLLVDADVGVRTRAACTILVAGRR